MLKHIVEKHPEEKIETIEFRAKVIKYTRSAFERQIRESVLIQENKDNHYILNSKSEYNRCSIPRLTTKMGEKELKEWEKNKELSRKEEKEREDEIKRKIYEIRREKNKERRNEEKEPLQATKRRKIGENEYKNVRQDERSQQEKREGENQAEQPHPKKVKIAPIFEQAQKQRVPAANTGREGGDPEMGKPTPGPKKIHYGGWEEKVIIEINWDKRIKEREEKEELEKRERAKRIKLAERLGKGWELIRVTMGIIKENSPAWEITKERKLEEKRQEMEKRERLMIADGKKRKDQENHLKKKIVEQLKLLPENEIKEIENNEKREKRLDLKEAKENIWKKWRKGNKLKAPKPTTTMDQMEIKLRMIEKSIEKIKKEREDLKERERKEAARRKKFVEEKRQKENEKIEKEKEKQEKIRKKKKLEQHWELIRWLTSFIEEKREDWECLDALKEAEIEHEEKTERWGKLEKDEKVIELQEELVPDEEKIEKAKRKRESWREWREPGDTLHPPQPPCRKRKVETLSSDSEGQKKIKTIGGGRGDPEMGKAPPILKKSPGDIGRGWGDPEMGKPPLGLNMAPSVELQQREPWAEKNKIMFREKLFQAVRNSIELGESPDELEERTAIPPHSPTTPPEEKLQWQPLSVPPVTVQEVSGPGSVGTKLAVSPKGSREKNKYRKNPENQKMSRTPIVKRWLETEKIENQKFKITKCTKFQEPTVSTSKKRKKMSKIQVTKKKQVQNFKKYFKIENPADPLCTVKTTQNTPTKPTSPRCNISAEAYNTPNVTKFGDIRKKFEQMAKNVQLRESEKIVRRQLTNQRPGQPSSSNQI